MKKDLLLFLAFISIVSCGGLVYTSDRDVSVVEITAKRYKYEPNVIPVKAGATTLLRIRSVDVLHGFSIPDLGVRADLEPGKVVEISLVSPKPGEYPFLCDIFCGASHSSMNGKIIAK